MLHFAYGSNMDRALMRAHAPMASPLGVAVLADHRFITSADGYASVEPARAHMVYGVLWQLTARDRVMLDAWENLAAGLYRARYLPVRRPPWQRPALVYVARVRGPGRPKPGYMELVLTAARGWNLPPDYVASLEIWLRAEAGGAKSIRGGTCRSEFKNRRPPP
ncbi:MAG: gamma-glutamylcyclotransferase family protein [Xanthobacteraceae bacterium]